MCLKPEVAVGAGQDLDSAQKGWCEALSDLFHLKPCARLACFFFFFKFYFIFKLYITVLVLPNIV